MLGSKLIIDYDIYKLVALAGVLTLSHYSMMMSVRQFKVKFCKKIQEYNSTGNIEY